MLLAALHGCMAAKHRFKDRQHGKEIYNNITLESETCGTAEQALTVALHFETLLYKQPGWVKYWPFTSHNCYSSVKSLKYIVNECVA